MPTPLFRLDLTRHLDPVLQLAGARPERVQLVAWVVRYLAHHTDGLDVIIVERPGALRPVEVLGAAWLDAVRRALGRESFGDVEAVVARVTEAVELELLGGQDLGSGWEELAEFSDEESRRWGGERGGSISC